MENLLGVTAPGPSQSLVFFQTFGGFIVELAHDGREITVEYRIEAWVVVSKSSSNRRQIDGLLGLLQRKAPMQCISHLLMDHPKRVQYQ